MLKEIACTDLWEIRFCLVEWVLSCRTTKSRRQRGNKSLSWKRENRNQDGWESSELCQWPTNGCNQDTHFSIQLASTDFLKISQRKSEIVKIQRQLCWVIFCHCHWTDGNWKESNGRRKWPEFGVIGIPENKIASIFQNRLNRRVFSPVNITKV